MLYVLVPSVLLNSISMLNISLERGESSNSVFACKVATLPGSILDIGESENSRFPCFKVKLTISMLTGKLFATLIWNSPPSLIVASMQLIWFPVSHLSERNLVVLNISKYVSAPSVRNIIIIAQLYVVRNSTAACAFLFFKLLCLFFLFIDAFALFKLFETTPFVNLKIYKCFVFSWFYQ